MAGARIRGSQSQHQAQSLTMTPALQQAIQLLQLPTIELRSILSEALETNPLLSDDEPNAATSPTLSPELIGSRPARQAGLGNGSTPRLSEIFGAGKQTSSGGRPDFEGDAGQQTVSGEAHAALLETITFAFLDPVDRNIALDLFALLDDAGYLAGSVEDIAIFRSCARSRVDGILKQLQDLAEPPGLFARDLRECLSLQLHNSGDLSPAMEALLNHLGLLADNKMDRLAEKCGVDPETMTEMIGKLRSLDPRPGGGLTTITPEVLIPDLQVRAVSENSTSVGHDEVRVGAWVVAVNPEIKPQLSADRGLYNRLREQSRSAKDKSYLTDQWQSATWLLRALDQRFATLLKTGAAVVQHQSEFMGDGLAALRPFTQREAAQLAEVHESTISRAAHDKYIETPQGTFPIGFFFSSAIENLNAGPPHSSKVVRQDLRALISNENKALSDDALTQLLRLKGYDVARRTVAKYRTQMRIPTSIRRRTQKHITY